MRRLPRRWGHLCAVCGVVVWLGCGDGDGPEVAFEGTAGSHPDLLDAVAGSQDAAPGAATGTPADVAAEATSAPADAPGRLQAEGGGGPDGSAATPTDGTAADGTATGPGRADAATDGPTRAPPTGPAAFELTLGGNGDDEIAAVHELPGGYLLAGTTTSLGKGDTDGLLARLGPCGAVQWLRRLGGSGADGFAALAPAGPGAVLLVGHTTLEEGDGDALLARVGADGEVQAAWRFGGDGADAALAVQPVAGDHVVLASTRSYGGGAPIQRNLWLFRVAADGQAVWSRVLWSQASLDGAALDEVPDADGGHDGWLVTGTTSTNKGDLVVLRLAADGQLLWARRVGGEAPDKGVAALVTAKGLLVAGSTRNLGASKSDVLLLDFSPQGDLGWVARLGTAGDDVGLGLRSSAAGTVLLAASNGLGKGEDALLVRLGPVGQPKAAWRIGGSQDDRLALGRATWDGGAVHVGGTWSWGNGGRDALVVKTADDGAGGCQASALANKVLKWKKVKVEAHTFAPFSASAPGGAALDLPVLPYVGDGGLAAPVCEPACGD